jgi:enoyl-CoA hydratase/carnithine racemase
MSYQYERISTDLANGVLVATLNNPPVNVMTQQMFIELAAFVDAVSRDKDVRVLVLQSANPDFFIAHFDIELILSFPVDGPARREDELNLFHRMCEQLRTMPKPTIAKIAGRVGGGGNEFSSCCDMRFGIRNKTVISQMEVALGILPGGGGTQQLPRLIGRSRAMEVILGADDLNAETAAQWGYLNRIFHTQADLDEFVDRLATRMALWPADAIALAKRSVLNADLPLEQGLREEAYLFQETLRGPRAKILMERALARGAQTRDGELRIADLCREVADE